MEKMPGDPIMLLSLVNMRLRDRYGSLEALCEDLLWPMDVLEQRLMAVGYRYDRAQNQFV